jgi:adenylosuccinate synthase
MKPSNYESLASIRSKRETEKFSRGILTFVVGMQFGSEAKGSIVQHLAPGVSNAVRTGAVNAGHTIYHQGEVHVMRQLPAAWTNPDTQLVIGAGALISPHVLMSEIERCEKIVPIKDRLLIDRNAHVITDEQIADEATQDLAERIGSTSSRGREGIGVAMADKVLRSARSIQAKDVDILKPFTTNTSDYLNEQLENQADVLVEGTQGYGLSIDHGEFPYVTSRNATVAALADSIGVQPEYYQTNIIGVTRTFPIRVAGNSGPFAEGSQELSWDEMKQVTGNPALSAEHTTVTGLPRRVATFSDAQFKDACRINRPTEIALTFADYLDSSVFKSDTVENSRRVLSFIEHIEALYDAPVSLVNTGPNATVDFDWSRRSRLRNMAS